MDMMESMMVTHMGSRFLLQDELVKDEVVEYGLEPDNYTGTDAPELIDAGTYTVYYRITATNYKPYTGSAIVTDQAERDSGCNGRSGDNLSGRSPKFTVDSVNGMVGEKKLLKIRMLFYHS